MAFRDQLEKAIKLAKSTGDKIIFFDSQGEEGYAIVPLDDYEKLAAQAVNSQERGLTEKGMLDKINRDIAEWSDYWKEREISDFLNSESVNNHSEESYDDFSKIKKWKIPTDRKVAAVEQK